ncbi:DNA-processing protein DprA [Kovacikia minuta CCNUW1]|nr:DNA-processing protein DprA [Kovacikia minuta]UBF29709.1 DNA-processing protein DprA [Kovacikia minuta CCNUW1]
MVEERAFWLAWSQMNGIGPILLRRLQKHFGTLADAWEASPMDLLEVDGLGSQTVETIAAERRHLDPDQLLQQHTQDNPDFWTPADPDYPQLLLEIPDPPALLYFRGQVKLQENQGLLPMVAIVGTRSPSEYGRRWTRRITTTLAQNGFTVVSGLAEGIDTEVHHSCLDMEGRTLAVLGTGVDTIYPWSNRNLYQQVVKQGLVLSEYPAGTQPDRIHFPRRNRIIAGLCRAVLVMEAPKKSGALITAYFANDYGRDIYILPGSLDNPKAIGCLNLWSKGAQPILSESHLLEMLGTIPQLQAPAQAQQTQLPLNLEPDLEKVLQAITDLSRGQNVESIPFDLIVQASELLAGSVSSALLQLELMGLVAQLPGMRYQRC